MIEKLLTPSSKKILVVGDVILDHYIHGTVDRISPEAPIPIVCKTSEAFKLGGAANVYQNLITLGAKCEIFSVLGTDDAGLRISHELNSECYMLWEDSKTTPVKTRILAGDQHILRIDDETKTPIKNSTVKELLDAFDDYLSDYCLIILSDYGKGVLANPSIAKHIIQKSKEVGIPVLVDPHNGSGDFSHYCGASMIKANRKQVNTLGCAAESIDKSLDLMISKFNLDMAMITLSEGGLAFKLAKDLKTSFISNTIREVFDVTGAGDSTLATFAYAISVGVSAKNAAKLANLAGNISVQHAGTYSVTVDDLMQTKPSKIILRDKLSQIKTDNNKVVFVNGCFDVLHPGHVELLQYAKKHGDVLIVGLNSDVSVKALKGDSRPIINEDDRAKMLAALECVDGICIFDETTPNNVIGLLRPDVHVKGNDHTNETDGVPVTLFFDRVGGYSTTKIIENR